jgi:hypothetical protein
LFCIFKGYLLDDYGWSDFLGILEFTIFPYSFFYSSIGIGIGALSVPFVVLELTDVFVPIGIGKGALSVVFIVLPLTDVLVPIDKGDLNIEEFAIDINR